MYLPQWSDGTQSARYDHIMHVHRDSIVGSITLYGPETVIKIPERDISTLDYREIYGQEENGYIPSRLIILVVIEPA